jgi:hypothetical protein
VAHGVCALDFRIAGSNRPAPQVEVDFSPEESPSKLRRDEI